MAKRKTRPQRPPGPFEHTPITMPGLYDIRSYDPDDVEFAKEDGIPFEDLKPQSAFQIWVIDDPAVGLNYITWPDDGSDTCYPVDLLWQQEWYTRRRVATQPPAIVA